MTTAIEDPAVAAVDDFVKADRADFDMDDALQEAQLRYHGVLCSPKVRVKGVPCASVDEIRAQGCKDIVEVSEVERLVVLFQESAEAYQQLYNQSVLPALQRQAEETEKIRKRALAKLLDTRAVTLAGAAAKLNLAVQQLCADDDDCEGVVLMRDGLADLNHLV